MSIDSVKYNTPVCTKYEYMGLSVHELISDYFVSIVITYCVLWLHLIVFHCLFSLAALTESAAVLHGPYTMDSFSVCSS